MTTTNKVKEFWTEEWKETAYQQLEMFGTIFVDNYGIPVGNFDEIREYEEIMHPNYYDC